MEDFASKSGIRKSRFRLAPSLEYSGENLGVSIEGQFIVLNSFGSGYSSEHNALYRKWERIANLIAAAPEMHRVLESLVRWDADFPVGDDTGKGLMELNAIIGAAAKVLAEAQGEVD